MNSVRLVPGKSVTGDSNVRHPQGDILNVRGFYDQNSHVMPEPLTEVSKVLVGEEESSWVEYVPPCYDGSQPVPLVISCHGGGQSGWGQAYATGWMNVANREGFIVVFPDAKTNKAWQVAGHRGGDVEIDPNTRDIQLMIRLIEEMAGKYNIDQGRVFMQGMSMGDLMTMQFARAFGEKLAGAANAAGPTPIEALFTEEGELRPYSVPVPVFQSRGEHDSMAISGGYDGKATRYDINRANLRYWCTINGCTEPPQFRITGKDNFAYFKGSKADVIFRDVKKRGHGQTFDDADIVWREFFSGLARRDGEIVRTETEKPARGDESAVILADGCSKMVKKNEIRPLKDGLPYNEQDVFELPPMPDTAVAPKFPKLEFDPCLYAPVTFLADAFEAEVEFLDESAVIRTKDGRTIEVAAGNIGCVIDNYLYSMERHAEYKKGMLYIPVKWFACQVFGKFASEHDGVVYISDHYGEMTNDMAKLIKEFIK